MIQSALRWTLPLAALLAIGPLAWLLTSHLRTPDGGPDASLLLSTTPLLGLLCGIAALVLAGAVGLAAAKLISPHYGLFSAGLVLAWAAWGTGRIDVIARAHTTLASGPPSDATFFLKLAVESLLLAPLALGLAWAMIRFGKPPAPHPEGHHAHHPHLPEPTALVDPRTPLGLLASMLVGGVIAWLIAQESLKGQTFAAAAFAGLFGAVAGRLVALQVSASALLFGVVLLGVVGPVIAMLTAGQQGALVRAAAGLTFNLARPLPLDWIAGAFVGTPLGLSWAASMIPADAHKPTPASARRLSA